MHGIGLINYGIVPLKIKQDRMDVIMPLINVINTSNYCKKIMVFFIIVSLVKKKLYIFSF